MRGEVSDASGHARALGVRPFRGDGLRTIDLSGKPARHRGLFERPQDSALPRRDSRAGEALQSGVRERTSRLAAVRDNRRPSRRGLAVVGQLILDPEGKAKDKV